MAGLAKTLASTALGLYYTAGARAAPMRQHLYERQLALVIRISRIVGRIRVFTPMVLDPDSPYHDRAKNDLGVQLPELVKAADLAAAILPTELYAEVKGMERIVTDFLVQHDEGADTSWFKDALTAHTVKMALLARTLLGVDELSTETAKVFGVQRDIERLQSMRSTDIVAAVKASPRQQRSKPRALLARVLRRS